MREIKFRAWDKKKKTMILFGSALTSFTSGFWGDGVDNYKIQFEREGETNGYNHDDFNEYAAVDLMQYTGLKDKNGKEIYDGDLIEGDHQQIYEVFFNDNKAIFSCCIRVGYHKNTYFEPYYSNDLLIEDVVVGDYEVIGNIPENSEILTNKGQ